MATGGMKNWADIEPVEMVPGVIRRTLNETADMMMTEVRGRAGSDVQLHSHPNQQITYVISGQLELVVEGATHVLNPGDSCAIPGGVQHSAHFPVDTVEVDSFYPPRPEYR